MAGSLRSRVDRLRKRFMPGAEPPTHGWGQSTEEINQQILQLPQRVAERAVALREEVYDRVDPEEWPELPLDKINGIDRAAHIVAVAGVQGWEAVPEEWIDYPGPPPLPELEEAIRRHVAAFCAEEGIGFDPDDVPEVDPRDHYTQDLAIFHEIRARAKTSKQADREEQLAYRRR